MNYSEYSKQDTSKCKEVFNCCPSNLITLIEFEFDERADGDDIPISIDSKNPTPVLETAFSTLCSGDIVWLNGVLVIDNENEISPVNLTIVIEKSSLLIDIPKPIYTLEVDLVAGSDDVSIPFSHVDVITSQLRNVRYKVLIYSDAKIDTDVDIEGPNTLTAIRFLK